MITAKVGELWRIGRHFLFIGDSRKLDNWDRLLDCRRGLAWGEFDGVFTSPPYADRRSKHYGGITPGEYVEWFDAIQENAQARLADGASFFVVIKPHTVNGQRSLYVYDLILQMVREWGWKFLDDLAWIRPAYPGRFKNRFKNAWEPILHFARLTDIAFYPEHVAGPLVQSYFRTYDTNRRMNMTQSYSGGGARNVRAKGIEGALPSNVIRANTGVFSSGAQYGATFPVELALFFLRAFSADPFEDKEENRPLWIDPFAGSGTLAEAAQLCGRTAFLMDTNPELVNMTAQRLARFGLVPKRM